MHTPMIAGVDGCRAGWVVARAPRWPCRRPPVLSVLPDFRAVLAATRACRAVAVDMPIGLPSGPELRGCDLEAIGRLGPGARQRLFLTPPRGALAARTPRQFQRLHRSLAGRGASLPVWGIAARLREVDDAMTPALQRRVVEAYPELAWARLAGALLPSKHTPAGLARRRAALSALVPGLDALEAWRLVQPSPRPQPDDLLDALVLLSVAAHAARRPAVPHRLPAGPPPRDARGLRMEIWY